MEKKNFLQGNSDVELELKKAQSLIDYMHSVICDKGRHDENGSMRLSSVEIDAFGWILFDAGNAIHETIQAMLVEEEQPMLKVV